MMEYPLAWPVGVARTASPRRSPFDTSESVARNGLTNELRLMNASGVVITTNMEIKANGHPYANQRIMDTGVAVYFNRQGQQQCIACDRWNTIRDNIQAIRKTVEALRGIERWGTGEMVDAAFQGFTALPAQASAGSRPRRQWYEVLSVAPSAPREVIEAARKTLLRKNHPDLGGNPVDFEEIERAYQEAIS